MSLTNPLDADILALLLTGSPIRSEELPELFGVSSIKESLSRLRGRGVNVKAIARPSPIVRTLNPTRMWTWHIPPAHLPAMKEKFGPLISNRRVPVPPISRSVT